MKYFALILLLILISSSAHAVTVYVNPFTSPSAGHAGTIGDPYQTWTEPCAALNGIGGLVLVNSGNYVGAGTNGTLYTNNCSGISSNNIVFQGNVTVPTNTPGAGASAPVLQNTNASSFSGRTVQIRFNTAYVTLQNMVINGSVANTECIQYETSSGTGQINHHITYDHLSSNGCGCDSLYGQGGDYYTFTNNVVTNGGATCSSASVSAIHIYQAVNFDTANVTHILVENNELSGESKGIDVGHESDGNGIQVVDDGNGTQNGWCAAINATRPGSCPYTGLVVIQNNIVNGNDGSGHSSFSSSNPTNLINNTFYKNVLNQTAGQVWSEITFNSCPGMVAQVYNNIVVSNGASYFCQLAEGTNGAFTVTANANNNNTCTTAFTNTGNASYSLGAGNNTATPNLTSPPTNFTPVAPSAAIGTANGAVAPPLNIFNNARTGSGGVCTAVGNPNMGAI